MVDHPYANLEGFGDGYEAALRDVAQTPTAYEKFVEEFANDYVDENYLVVALNEEAGEVAGWYKKFVLRGNPTGKLTREDLLSELGDIQYYLTRLANLNGWSLDEVKQYNMDKLRARVAAGKRSVG
jgi:NTP pyrophosphatase (non-canonical NTP hydrolase)